MFVMITEPVANVLDSYNQLVSSEVVTSIIGVQITC